MKSSEQRQTIGLEEINHHIGQAELWRMPHVTRWPHHFFVEWYGAKSPSDLTIGDHTVTYMKLDFLGGVTKSERTNVGMGMNRYVGQEIGSYDRLLIFHDPTHHAALIGTNKDRVTIKSGKATKIELKRPPSAPKVTAPQAVA